MLVKGYPQQHVASSHLSGLLIGCGKKSNFAGFLVTDLPKNWPVSQKCSGLTSPKKDPQKMANFEGIFWANFARR